MDAADAMEVTESIPAELSTVEADRTNDKQVEPDETTNDVAMQQLSLEPAEVPLRTPSPTYHESPSTDPGSPLAPDGVVEEEKEKETEDSIDSSEPRATENTVQQNAEQATLDLSNPSTALTTTTTTTEGNTGETIVNTEMEEDAPAIPEPTETPNNSTEDTVPQIVEQVTLDPPNASTTLTTTTTTEGNTGETIVDTEMEEDAPAIPEPTETPNNPTTEAPSSDPPTANNAASPAPTAMDEDENDEAAKPEANPTDTTGTNTHMAVAKDVSPNVVDDTDGQENPKVADVPDKGKGKDKDAEAAGWGVAEPENSSLGGAANTDTNLDGWGPREIGTSGWSTGGGDTNTSLIQLETNNDTGNGNGSGGGTGNGESGFGSRTGGWGNRGRDRDSGRDSYGSRDRDRDRDSFRDKDGLRRTRPASFGNGFGSGAPPFASGSNTELLLPPLGRSPVKNLNSDRHARLARSAPYPPRRETRSGDWGSGGLDYGNAGLDYGSAGDGDDFGVIRGGGGARGRGAGGINGNGPVILSQKPVVLNEMDLGGLNTLSKMMNNADIKAITNSLMDHIGQIQKWRNRSVDAHNLVRQCGHDYTERKAELQASLSVESDPQKKAAIASKLEAHRLKGRNEENLLGATVLNTETAMKREVEALIHTISEAMADKIHACILDVVRAVSTSGMGVGCDVEKVVERCVSIATPKLVRDQLGAQEKLIRGLERRVGQLDDSLQERDKTIVDLIRRLKRLEGKVANEAEGGHDLMVTDNDTSHGTSSTATAITDGDSDSLAAQSRSSYGTNCVPQ